MSANPMQSAPRFLAAANDLDEAIRQQDQLILRATVQEIPPRFIWAAVAVRNDLVREWGELWRTKAAE